MLALRRSIRDAKIQRRANKAVRARDKKYIGAASVPSGADETSDGSEAIF